MLAFKKSIYSVLSGDGTLTALTTINEVAKLDQDLPFVDLADILELNWSAKDFVGSQYMMRVHIFAESTDSCLQIAERIRTLLNRVELTVVGKNFVDMQHEDTEVLIDKDNITLHCIVTFRAFTHG